MLRLLLSFFFLIISSTSFSDEYVNGYYKKDGTFVQGYFKSSPNKTNVDNYSTQGNLNPYTGIEGYRAPDYSSDALNYGDSRTIYTGPRGGQYYYSDSGRKVYVPKR